MSDKPKPETAKEWGARQAALAPPWSDKQWRKACAALGLEMKGDRCR